MLARRKVKEPRARPIELQQAVYLGRKEVGSIAAIGDEWLAYDIDNKPIGRFPTRLSAFAAAIRSAR